MKYLFKECVKCNKSTKVLKLQSASKFELEGSGWNKVRFRVKGKRNLNPAIMREKIIRKGS